MEKIVNGEKLTKSVNELEDYFDKKKYTYLEKIVILRIMENILTLDFTFSSIETVNKFKEILNKNLSIKDISNLKFEDLKKEGLND